MGLLDDDYVCSLSPDTEKFAKEDLREDEATRKHGIEALREWINKNPDITNCRTGKFLFQWEFWKFSKTLFSFFLLGSRYLSSRKCRKCDF
jgi:hypothetical protein